MQHVLRATNNDCVSGVGPPLIPCNNVRLLGEHIYNFPLPFIPPLGTDDDFDAHGSGCSRNMKQPRPRWPSGFAGIGA